MKLLLAFLAMTTSLGASQPTFEDLIAAHINKVTSPRFSGRVRLVNDSEGNLYLKKCGSFHPVTKVQVERAIQDIQQKTSQNEKKQTSNSR